MRFHRMQTDHELVGDGGIVGTSGDQAQHVDFAQAEGFTRFGQTTRPTWQWACYAWTVRVSRREQADARRSLPATAEGRGHGPARWPSRAHRIKPPLQIGA